MCLSMCKCVYEYVEVCVYLIVCFLAWENVDNEEVFTRAILSARIIGVSGQGK